MANNFEHLEKGYLTGVQLGGGKIQVVEHGHLEISERKSKSQFTETYLIHGKYVGRVHQTNPIVLLRKIDHSLFLDTWRIRLHPHSRKGILRSSNEHIGSFPRIDDYSFILESIKILLVSELLLVSLIVSSSTLLAIYTWKAMEKVKSTSKSNPLLIKWKGVRIGNDDDVYGQRP